MTVLHGGLRERERERVGDGQSIGLLSVILFFGPCIFNNEDKNKPTKCTN